jgi:hypothetical protein
MENWNSPATFQRLMQLIFNDTVFQILLIYLDDLIIYSTTIEEHIEHICSFFVAFFSATIDGRNLIFGHKLHIGTPYRGKRFLTHQIPTSCFPKNVTNHKLGHNIQCSDQ